MASSAISWPRLHRHRRRHLHHRLLRHRRRLRRRLTKLVLRGVHFDFNKSNIRPGDAAVLDEAITILKQNPTVVVDVNGYCDIIGGMEYNQKLSERRANAVANYLLQWRNSCHRAEGERVRQDQLHRDQQDGRRPR